MRIIFSFQFTNLSLLLLQIINDIFSSKPLSNGDLSDFENFVM